MITGNLSLFFPKNVYLRQQARINPSNVNNSLRQFSFAQQPPAAKPEESKDRFPIFKTQEQFKEEYTSQAQDTDSLAEKMYRERHEDLDSLNDEEKALKGKNVLKQCNKAQDMYNTLVFGWIGKLKPNPSTENVKRLAYYEANIGQLLYEQGDYKKAMGYFKKALTYYESIKDKMDPNELKLGQMFSAIGIIKCYEAVEINDRKNFSEQKKPKYYYSDITQAYLVMLKHMPETNLIHRASTNHSLAIVYSDSDSPDENKALKHFTAAAELYKKINADYDGARRNCPRLKSVKTPEEYIRLQADCENKVKAILAR